QSRLTTLNGKSPLRVAAHATPVRAGLRLDRGARASQDGNKTGDQQPEKQPIAGPRIRRRRNGGGQRDIGIGDGIEAGMREDPALKSNAPTLSCRIGKKSSNGMYSPNGTRCALS